MRTSIIISLSLTLSLPALATKTLDELLIESRISKRGDKPREHVADPYRIKRLADYKVYANKVHQKCKEKHKKFYFQLKCTKELRKEWYAKNPDRGTTEFGDKFYASMTELTAKAKLKELIGLIDYVSFNPKYIKTENIELTVDILHRETMYIERYVLKQNPNDYRDYR
ncbi:MAG: hypothetical protein HRU24_13155 [Gammaproteobacteria bacterium]|nr:hypothetical protein [Gammaproteobacteria bacterium]